MNAETVTTFCQECARPWGIILKRGEAPTPEGTAEARAQLIADLREAWECDEEDETVARVDWDALPKVDAIEVVYITEAFADFCCDHGFAEMFGDGACWIDIQWCDVPAWLLKGRKRRWAYWWDCCEIGFASNFVPVSVLGADTPRDTK